MWAAAFVAGGLVGVCPVDGEVADELVVDEHGGVGVVDDHDGVAVGVAAADVDDEFWMRRLPVLLAWTCRRSAPG